MYVLLIITPRVIFFYKESNILKMIIQYHFCLIYSIEICFNKTSNFKLRLNIYQQDFLITFLIYQSLLDMIRYMYTIIFTSIHIFLKTFMNYNNIILSTGLRLQLFCKCYYFSLLPNLKAI